MPVSLRIEALGAETGGGYELRLVLRSEVRVLRDPECQILWRSAIVIAAAAARSEAPAPSAPPAAPPPAPAPSPAPTPPAASPPPANRPAPPLPPRVAPAQPANGRPALATRPSRARPPRTRPRRPPEQPGAVAAADELRAPQRAVAGASIASPALGELRAGLALGVGVSGGVLPDLGGVLDLGARLELLPWALDVSIRYWPERSQSREGRVVDVASAGGRVAGLFRVASALNLMAGIEVNRLVGEGAEGVSGRNADAVWQLAPTAGFSLITWDIRSLRLEIGAAGRVSLARPRFLVTGFGDLYRVPLLGADAIIRGVWLFP